MLLSLAAKSLKSRRQSVLLTLLSMFISIALLITVEHIRIQAKESFKRTVSGVDLIVGARTGQLNLLLSSVFRIGSSSTPMSQQSVELLKENSQVSWLVPIALGDSHDGHSVIGTTSEYFAHFKYGDKQALAFASGDTFNHPFGAVLGAAIANEKGYTVGDELVLSHGHGNVSFSHHDEAPFTITGILKPTGTPIDNSIHVSMQGLTAVHLAKPKLQRLVQDYEEGRTLDIPQSDVSAVFIGLTSPIAVLRLQQVINNYQGEALTAVMPGVALDELWQLVGMVENLLIIIAFLILVASLLGLATMLLANMRERRQEFAVLRTIGARPWNIFLLIQLEALLLSVVATGVAIGFVGATLFALKGFLSERFGIFISAQIFTVNTAVIALIVILSTFVVACLPAISAYRNSLHLGLNAK